MKNTSKSGIKDLTQGNIYKTFLLFAIPLILSGFLSQAYSIIDTIIAGKALSEHGLAAIGATSALNTLLSSIFWGYGTGYSIYLARLFGAKDYKRLKTSIYVNYSAMILAIILVSILIVFFKEPIFDVLKIDTAIREDAGIYFVICTLGLVCTLMSYNGVYIMNALGNSSYPFWMSVISTVLNIGGNLFTVFILKWGVAGLAISTVFSALVVDIFYFAEIKKCLKIMGVDKYKIIVNLKTIKAGSIYSLPTTIQQTLMYLASLVISPMVNGIGSSATAAYVICQKMHDVNATLFQNSSKTVSNYIAQSMGAKKYQNIQRGLRVGFLQGTLFVLPVLIFSSLNAEWCCSMFVSTKSGDAGLQMAIVFTKYFLPFILFNMVNNLFHSFYRGIAAMYLLMISSFIGSAAQIGATYYAVPLYGMNGVYIGWAVSWIVECLFSLVIYFSGIWKTKEIGMAEKGVDISV